MEPNDFWLWIAAIVLVAALLSLAWGIAGWVIG